MTKNLNLNLRNLTNLTEPGYLVGSPTPSLQHQSTRSAPFPRPSSLTRDCARVSATTFFADLIFISKNLPENRNLEAFIASLTKLSKEAVECRDMLEKLNHIADGAETSLDSDSE